MIPLIPNHADLAIARLISQYANAENLQNLIRALIVPVQEIEGVLEQLNLLRQLAIATGIQLDLLGTIIGLARFPGDSDDLYRQKLYAEIKVNTSQGQPEQAIQTYQLFTSAALVILTEFFPAEIIIASEYMPPDQDTVDLLLSILNKVLPAGVRADGIISFDPTEAFAYDGSLPGLGYGTVGDPSVGGKYPFLFTHNQFFEYAGNDGNGLGYGSTDDPLVGGWYASV